MSKRNPSDFNSKDKRKLPIFIQSELDDYGLTCVEFRVYARIARRAGGDNKLTESVPNMALAFGVADSTVRRALQVLCVCRLISRTERSGWTPEYSLNDQERWVDKAELLGVREAVLHPNKKGDSLVTTDRGIPADPSHQGQGGLVTTDRGPLSPEIDEGTPVKVLPEGTPISARAKPVKEKPGPELKTLYPPEDFAVTEPLLIWLGEMLIGFTDAELADLTGQWHISRGSENQSRARTLGNWQNDWKRYMRKTWDGRQNGGGNGKRFESAAERGARYTRESLDYLNNLSAGSGENPPESEVRLLTTGTRTPATRPRY